MTFLASKEMEISHDQNAKASDARLRRLELAATAAEMAPRLGITEARLLELATLGYAPHFVIDDNGPPLFWRQEIAAWAQEHLWRRSAGRPFPTELLILADQPIRSAPPSAISMLTGLRQYPMPPPVAVVYFLVSGEEIVYVGQSVGLPGRIDQHRKEKDFDRVFYLTVPRDDLNAVEAAFIVHLKPRLNGRMGSGMGRAPAHEIIAAFIPPARGTGDAEPSGGTGGKL
jgi:hypothetical protein